MNFMIIGPILGGVMKKKLTCLIWNFFLVMLKSQPNRPGPNRPGPEKKQLFFNVLFKRMPPRLKIIDRFI